MAESAAKPAIKVRFYRFRNRLKDKAAGLGSGNGAIEIDELALLKAEEALAAAAQEYPDWVLATVQTLAQHHQTCVTDPAARRGCFDLMRRIAHDLKGQGGTFGYPLVTSVAASLFRFTSAKDAIDDDHVELIKAHVDAIRAIVRERMAGDGGEMGTALSKGLDQAIQKFSARI